MERVPGTCSSQGPRSIAGVQARNAVVVLLDSLNRHMLGSYGGTEFDTPNLDRFARRTPCASRSTTAGRCRACPPGTTCSCGSLDFLWRPWGSIELWEEPITVLLRRAGVVTKLVTDHPHLFETGGENYHVDFTAWDYQRGHESDQWRTRPDPSWIGAPQLRPRSHARTTTPVAGSAARSDFPGPRVMPRGVTLARAGGAGRRALPAVRRRVRPARAVRHARAVRVDVRRRLGGSPSPHLAAVRGRRGRAGRALRARRPPAPRAVRRQAHDDRRVVRPAARRARTHGPPRRHVGDRVHRPRPLPRREGHLGQARLPDLRAARAHAAARRVARALPRESGTRSRPTSTSTRRSATCSA